MDGKKIILGWRLLTARVWLWWVGYCASGRRDNCPVMGVIHAVLNDIGRDHQKIQQLIMALAVAQGESLVVAATIAKQGEEIKKLKKSHNPPV